MLISISLDVAFKKGTRVAYRKGSLYYLGTVAKAGEPLTVNLDSGDVVTATTRQLKVLLINKTGKRAYVKGEIDKFINKPKAKPVAAPKAALPSGLDDYIKLNKGSKRLPKIEGYWRNGPTGRSLPFPVPNCEFPGYSKAGFIRKVKALQKKAVIEVAKGDSPNRIYEPGEPKTVGANAYTYNGWHWPEGYLYYIERGTLPSKAFYKFVMGKVLDLPLA